MSPSSVNWPTASETEGRWTPSHDELQEFLEKHDNIYV